MVVNGDQFPSVFNRIMIGDLLQCNFNGSNSDC